MFTEDLFSDLEAEPIPIINQDGRVDYHGVVIPIDEADNFFDALLTKINWANDQSSYFGELTITKRKVAWYADAAFKYTYSNTTKVALPWIQELIELKERIENITGYQFNACLLNLYHDGEEGMAWHSDSEKDLLKNGAIASLSFGAERKFAFKHKTSQATLSVVLQHGSLLVMKGQTQDHWLHRLPPSKKVSTPRINLTFRTIQRKK